MSDLKNPPINGYVESLFNVKIFRAEGNEVVEEFQLAALRYNAAISAFEIEDYRYQDRPSLAERVGKGPLHIYSSCRKLAVLHFEAVTHMPIIFDCRGGRDEPLRELVVLRGARVEPVT